MKKTDLHTHTTYCDGRNTPEEMVRAAVRQGLDCIGFSGHSYTAFDESYCMSKAGTAAYGREVAALKEKYAGQIRVLCGIEQDYYADAPAEAYDYRIGSVHYLLVDGAYVPVDESAEMLREAVKTHFGGDWYALTELYFRTAADVVRKTGADIIGHFDLVSKFNEKERLFDEEHPRYQAAWRQAADQMLRCGKPFEINTGAISRGYKTIPYPSPAMIDYIRARGGSLILCSDSHSAETLCYGFAEARRLCRGAVCGGEQLLQRNIGGQKE